MIRPLSFLFLALWATLFFVHSALAAPAQARAVEDASTTSAESANGTFTGEFTQTPTSFSATGDTPGTVGHYITTLERGGRPSVLPFPTGNIEMMSSTTEAAASETADSSKAKRGLVGSNVEERAADDLKIKLAAATTTTAMNNQNAFVAISTGAPPTQITSRSDHPVAKLGITGQTGPSETNKFYANFFLDAQQNSVFVHPYSLQWAKGAGNAASWGMAISHVEASQRADGPTNTALPGSPISYFINPIGIQSMIMSATELGTSTNLTTDTLQGTSVNVNLLPTKGSSQKLTMPLVQGMGFVTGIYTNLQPAVQSSVFFRTIVSAGSPKTGVYKYRVTLEDGNSWLVYVMSSDGSNPTMTLVSNTLFRGPANFTGTIQIAKNPASTVGEAAYDTACGTYATTTTISGSVTGTVGTYTFTFTKAGPQKSNGTLLMYALPHQVASFGPKTKAAVQAMQLQTTTKGLSTAVLNDFWTMIEPELPMSMGFSPWNVTTNTSVSTFSTTAIKAIQSAAASELQQNMTTQCDLNSMYYSGKALAKFAGIVYATHDIAGDTTLAATGLTNLKKEFSRFVNNTQIYPLVYDTVWKGAVSVGTYLTGDSGLDFGNTYYNDHHFHYGYFIYAAAVIGYLDPTWVSANKAWVNMLVRDTSNPITTDPYFPFSRSFDWFHGHSWAKGLFASGDSKDEESSSEDAMYAYAVKMWGQTVGDASMEARGNLMLSVLGRSLQNYFLMESTNVNQPSNFIANKATGILFENKIDHTTYFGANLEYIQGIHMLPLLPCSALTRSKTFVSEEWTAFFADGAVDPASSVAGGWRGILYANLALISPKSAWTFFAASGFDTSYLDGGASLTWYLTWAAGLGGA